VNSESALLWELQYFLKDTVNNVIFQSRYINDNILEGTVDLGRMYLGRISNLSQTGFWQKEFWQNGFRQNGFRQPLAESLFATTGFWQNVFRQNVHSWAECTLA
jgi:hypothetical protein